MSDEQEAFSSFPFNIKRFNRSKGLDYDIYQPFLVFKVELSSVPILVGQAEEYIAYLTTMYTNLDTLVNPPVSHSSTNRRIVLTPTDQARLAYIEVLKTHISGIVYGRSEYSVTSVLGRAKKEVKPYDESERKEGKVNTYLGTTMTTPSRMSNVQELFDKIIMNKKRVPGAFVETGVWRGGSSGLARGIMRAYNQGDRLIYLCDSFQGLPPGDLKLHRDDKEWDNSPFLEVSAQEVGRNLKALGVLDPNVIFVQGFFNATMPPLAKMIGEISILRMDGDMYESTVDVLYHLYDKVSVEGFIIMDDWYGFPSRQACEDFFAVHDFSPEIIDIDNKGVYWQKTQEIEIQYWRYEQLDFKPDPSSSSSASSSASSSLASSSSSSTSIAAAHTTTKKPVSNAVQEKLDAVRAKRAAEASQGSRKGKGGSTSSLNMILKDMIDPPDGVVSESNPESPYFDEKRTFFVNSFGGSGSTMLSKLLINYGTVHHIHVRDPPLRLEKNGKPAAHSEWFNGEPYIPAGDERVDFFFIYRNPVDAILSRFTLLGSHLFKEHLRHVNVNDSITLDDVIESGEDLYSLEEFFDNNTKQKPGRTYPIHAIRYGYFGGENITAFMEQFGLQDALELHPDIKERGKSVQPEVRTALENIYAPLIAKIEQMSFISSSGGNAKEDAPAVKSESPLSLAEKSLIESVGDVSRAATAAATAAEEDVSAVKTFTNLKEEILYHWQHGHVFDVRHYLAHEDYVGINPICSMDPMLGGAQIPCLVSALLRQAPYLNLAARKGKSANSNAKISADSIKWKDPITITHKGKDLGLHVLYGGAFNQVASALWGVGLAKRENKALVAPNFHSRTRWAAMKKADCVRLGFAGFFDLETFALVTEMTSGVPIVPLNKDVDERDGVFAKPYNYDVQPLLGDVLPSQEPRMEVIGKGFTQHINETFPPGISPTMFAQIILSMVPEKKLLKVVDKILFLLPARFNAVHARLEDDWEAYADRELLGPSVDERINGFVEAMRKFGDTNLPLYITGGFFPDNLMKILEDDLGFKVFTKNALLGGKENGQSEDHDDELELDQWAIVDSFVALHSIKWIGVTESSFSELLHFRRIYLDRACCQTTNISYLSTQCFRNDERCKPSTLSWGMVEDKELLGMHNDPLTQKLCDLYPRFTSLHCVSRRKIGGKEQEQEQGVEKLPIPSITTLAYDLDVEVVVADMEESDSEELVAKE